MFTAANDHRDMRSFVREGRSVHYRSEKSEAYPATEVTVQKNGQIHRERLYYSHQALGRLVTSYDFQSVLEVGAGTGAAARIMKFLGKDVTGIDVVAALTPGVVGDFVSTKFPHQYDCVWASHVLEHQRNVGAFLDKCFDVLEEGGVLAVTIPSALSPVIFGHPTILTIGHMLYHLVLAGFDCRDASVLHYDQQQSIILRKKGNGIQRLQWACTPYVADDLAYAAKIVEWFPREMPFNEAGHAWGEIERINWPDGN